VPQILNAKEYQQDTEMMADNFKEIPNWVSHDNFCDTKAGLMLPSITKAKTKTKFIPKYADGTLFRK